MNIQQLSWSSARNICIVKTLAKLGHYPTRKSEKEAWFLSPLRSETQASFSVSFIKNLWFDYGLGKGGNIINLIMDLNSCSFKEALSFLSGDFSNFSFCPPLTRKHKNKENQVIITGVTSIDHPGLIQYLIQRGIPLSMAHTYCKEVHYRCKSKEYFAIGMKNYLGGWELRNKYFKNSSSPKSLSFISHASDHLIVTEGMFDFLSLAVLDNALVNASDGVVLNSLAFLRDAMKIIPAYKKVLLFLDNDHAGDKATAELLDFHSNIKDASDFYTGYVDLNDKLKDEKCEKK